MIWQPWPTWDCLADAPGPLHGPRIDKPDGKKEIPWPPGSHPAQLLYFAGDHRPPPPGSPLVLTEGEKAADAVAAVGFLAAGTVCGASSTPEPAVLELLSRYRVCLAPDNDEPGWHHMGRISRAVMDAGGRCYIVDPPWFAPKGWDLADAEPKIRRGLIMYARPMGWYLEPDE